MPSATYCGMRVFWLGLLLLAACGDDDVIEDAGGDTEVDVGVDVGPPPDAGPQCEMSCARGQACCLQEAGPTCIDVTEDADNCGACGIVCAEGRGTVCQMGRCVCGASETGCAGDDGNFCCPPSDTQPRSYCANLLTAGDDCGECGQECEAARSDRCVGGLCRCGLGRGACDGTPTSTCCPSPFAEVRCIDLTSDREFCGSCDTRCVTTEERCESGTCTVGAGSCAEGCEAGELCCGGACCPRGRCSAGTCLPPVDAGADAGSDAGLDAEVDAGLDAGLDAGES